MKRITQTQKVISHLIDHGSITPLEAQSNYNIWRLAAVIHKLKKAGVKIASEMRRMQRQHQLGFAVMTGHNLKDTSRSYRW